jgi:rhombotail lipoprotein
VNLSEQLRSDSLNGFKEASQELIKNLDEQLAQFKEKVRASPQDFQVARKPGYKGGGSVDAGWLGLALTLGGLMIWGRRKRKSGRG